MIGIVIAAAAALVAILFCKRRRSRRIRLSISRPLPVPSNPFENPRDSPSPVSMRYAASDSSNRNLVGSGLGIQTTHPSLQRSLLDEEIEDIPVPFMSHPSTSRALYNGAQSGLAGVGSGEKGVFKPPQFQTVKSYTPSIRSPSRVRPPSLTPSTPSVYPSSLPPTDDDDTTHDSHGPVTPSTTERQTPFPTTLPARPPRRRPVPPIPPRNPMRANSAKSNLVVRTDLAAQDAQANPRPFEPLTPPASDGSTSPNRTSIVNPFADYNRYVSDIRTPLEAKTRDNFYTRRKVSVSSEVCA